MHKGQATDGIVRLILTSVGILAFISLIATSYQIMNENTPQVLNNCVKKPSLLPYNTSSGIASMEEGLQFLQDAASERMAFVEDTIELCESPSVGYVYVSAANKSYIACSDGKTYIYEDVCTEGGKAKSFVAVFKKSNGSSEIEVP